MLPVDRGDGYVDACNGKCVGEESITNTFTCSVRYQGAEAPKQANFVLSDTAVQENTTFPASAGLYEKAIDRCSEVAVTALFANQGIYRERLIT